QLLGGALKVGRRHNVIGVEDRTRPVAAHLHRDLLGDAGIHEVAHASPSKIVAQRTRMPGAPARALPRLAIVLAALPHEPLRDTPATEGREQAGDHAAQLALELVDALDVRAEHLGELPREVDHAAIVVLRGAGIENDTAALALEVDLAEVQLHNLGLRPPP